MGLNINKVIAMAAVMIMTAAGTVSAQKTKCLRSIDSEIQGDVNYYEYNADGTLDSMYLYLAYYDEQTYCLYTYDDRGNMIKEEGFGIAANGQDQSSFVKIFEVMYGFDENNRRISRKNYNADTWSGTNEMFLGGVYTYQYDEKGLLTQRKLYWDEAMKDLCETTDFTYGEGDRLMKETYTVKKFGGESVDMIVDYEYDEKGHNTSVTAHVKDYETGEMYLDNRRIYEYDEAGNLTTRTIWDSMSKTIPAEKHILLYDGAADAGDVAFPINYENDMDFFTLSKNTAVQDSIYRRDAEGTLFCLYDVQNWNYDDFVSDTGISCAHGNDAVLNVVRDAEGNMTITGNDIKIRVYDHAGRNMHVKSRNGKVYTSLLPQGIYILVTDRGSMKFLNR